MWCITRSPRPDDANTGTGGRQRRHHVLGIRHEHDADPEPMQSESRTMRMVIGGGADERAPPPSRPAPYAADQENRPRNRGLLFHALSNSPAAPDAISLATRDGHLLAW